MGQVADHSPSAFPLGHFRRTGVELTRHPELFNHGSP